MFGNANKNDGTVELQPTLLHPAWKWLFSSHPQGFGTLLLGFAAVFALIRSSSLLDRVLQIQKQSRDIAYAVSELKHQSGQISAAIELLGAQLKNLKATQTVASSPVLNEPHPSREQIKEAVRQSIRSQPSTGESSIFLPEKDLEITVDRLFRASNPAEREAILQKSLKIKSSPLIDENGSRITTKGGAPVDVNK